MEKRFSWPVVLEAESPRPGGFVSTAPDEGSHGETTPNTTEEGKGMRHGETAVRWEVRKRAGARPVL